MVNNNKGPNIEPCGTPDLKEQSYFLHMWVQGFKLIYTFKFKKSKIKCMSGCINVVFLMERVCVHGDEGT